VSRTCSSCAATGGAEKVYGLFEPERNGGEAPAHLIMQFLGDPLSFRFLGVKGSRRASGALELQSLVHRVEAAHQCSGRTRAVFVEAAARVAQVDRRHHCGQAVQRPEHGTERDSVEQDDDRQADRQHDDLGQ
jgi:hypothetical protein